MLSRPNLDLAKSSARLFEQGQIGPSGLSEVLYGGGPPSGDVSGQAHNNPFDSLMGFSVTAVGPAELESTARQLHELVLVAWPPRATGLRSSYHRPNICAEQQKAGSA